MTNDLRRSVRSYSDLLKRTLKYSQWPTYQPLNRPYFYDDIQDVLRSKGSIITKIQKSALVYLQKMLTKRNLSIMKGVGFTQQEWHPWAHTMVSWERLTNIEDLMIRINDDSVIGDFMEAGVWRGGSTILMAGLAKFMWEEPRRIFVADSFEGLPKPDSDKFPNDKGDTHHRHDFLAIDLNTVKNNFEKYGVLSDRVVFIKGFFKDSLPAAPVEQLALLRVDADMYEGTIQVLEHLYDKISLGGFVIIDDYGALPNQCGKAVDEFRSKRNITSPLVHVDYSAVYWRKEAS